MTPSEAKLIRLVASRTRTMQPAQIEAYMRVLDQLRAVLGTSRVVDLLAANRVDAILRDVLSDEVIDRSFAPFRQQLFRGLDAGFRFTVADIAKARIPTARIEFGVTNPRVIEAAQKLNQLIIPQAKADVRETVRQAVEAGLRAGQNPRTTARQLRDVIGLSPTQERWVREFDEKLRAGDRNVLRDLLSEKRLPKAVRSAIEDGKPLPAAFIDARVAARRARSAAQHADTLTRTATLQAYKQANYAAYASAVDSGVVSRDRAYKRWLTVLDSRVRDEHAAIHGEEVPFDAAYSTGEVIPGSSTYNCRCVSQFFLKAA